MSPTRRRRATLAVATALATAASTASLAATATAQTSSSSEAAAAAGTTQTQQTQQVSADIKTRLSNLRGVESVQEKTAPAGYRFFTFTFDQPVDHDRPGKGRFAQRLTLLHKDTSRPMVMYTSGYNVSENPTRSEPTRIVDGNQLSMEYRFFEPSRPATPSWTQQLTIRQAAEDQHRIITAFKRLYQQSWLTTGGSKGGMTATYHRRFYPYDVDGTIPYVAPNDVRDEEDVYDSFLDAVGTSSCRTRLTALQRRVLGPDRSWFLPRSARDDEAEGNTYEIVGSKGKALESSVVDAYFAFWQYSGVTACGSLPDPAADRETIYQWYEAVSPLDGYADQALERYVPYYFQAAYQLGAPEPYEQRIGDLLKYPGTNNARTFVPDDIEARRFDRAAMPDIDQWVRTSSSQMLYVYGQNDPWSAEPFSCGTKGWQRDCHRYYVDDGTHGSNIAGLGEADRTAATEQVLRWAGLSQEDPAAKTLRATGKPAYDPQLDRPERQRGTVPALR